MAWNGSCWRRPMRNSWRAPGIWAYENHECWCIMRTLTLAEGVAKSSSAVAEVGQDPLLARHVPDHVEISAVSGADGGGPETRAPPTASSLGQEKPKTAAAAAEKKDPASPGRKTATPAVGTALFVSPA